MSVVRLLMRRADEVFCVPRPETGSLDLPMRIAPSDDPAGIDTVSTLAGDVIGARCDLTFVGGVRNVVEQGATDYPWPTPEAYFGVWSTTSGPVVEGVWLTLTGEDSLLREKHWYPLVSGRTRD